MRVDKNTSDVTQRHFLNIMKLLAERCSEPWTSARIAAEVGLNPSYAMRLFRVEGVRPSKSRRGQALPIVEGVRPCLLTFMAFSADLLPCQESREWNMLGLFTT